VTPQGGRIQKGVGERVRHVELEGKIADDLSAKRLLLTIYSELFHSPRNGLLHVGDHLVERCSHRGQRVGPGQVVLTSAFQR
jgi:hypothetical protein